MQLSDLRLAVRPRSAYEAMDVGIRLVQTEAGLLYRVWFAVTLPVLLLVLALITLTGNKLAYLLLWWLKPLYDYALLIVLSRRVFGATPRLRDVLLTLAGSWRHGLIGFLGWRRLSMSRAYLLPVWLLENLPGRERNARIALLRNGQTGRARWLHIVMVHFETIMLLTGISLLFWFAPESHFASLWDQLTKGSADAFVPVAQTLAYFMAISLIEPFYVAAGFALYLNRRTELEAWDLELAFRHLRERLDVRQVNP